MSLTPGSRLGVYEIVSLLGEGGMGAVYRARDTRPELAREVAIKVLLGASGSDDSRRRFEQEARAMAALNHPNVLAIYDVGSHPSTSSGQAGTIYLVEELLDGATLRDAVAKGALAPRKAHRVRPRDRAGARRGAREGVRASRPEARERDAHERRAREDSRLRPRQAASAGAES